MKISDLPIRFRIAGGEIRTIPQSQEARFLRTLWLLPGECTWDDLYRALGSHEVSRCISRLRNKWAVPVVCSMVPKVSGKGKVGLYHLGEGVEVVGEEGR